MNQNHFNQNNQYYQPQGGNFNQNPYRPPMMNEELKQRIYIQNRKREEKNSLIKDGIVIGGAILAYLIIQTIIVYALQESDYYTIYMQSSVFQNAFNIIAVHICSMAIPFSLMALILKKRFTGSLIPTASLSGVQYCAWVSLGMGACMGSNFITNLVIELFKKGGYELSQPELLEVDSPIACIVLIFSTAVVPAIFEEYAMRCCTLGALKGRGKPFAVVAVSIVFGLIHGNLIQFVFAFFVGLILGYITVVTDSVVPAMLIHGLNNGISVVQEILQYTSGKTVATYVSGAIVYIWIALAIWGLAYLIKKRGLLPKKEEKRKKEPYELSFGAKLLCLLPGFALPFLILIYITSQFIQRVG